MQLGWWLYYEDDDPGPQYRALSNNAFNASGCQTTFLNIFSENLNFLY